MRGQYLCRRIYLHILKTLILLVLLYGSETRIFSSHGAFGNMVTGLQQIMRCSWQDHVSNEQLHCESSTGPVTGTCFVSHKALWLPRRCLLDGGGLWDKSPWRTLLGGNKGYTLLLALQPLIERLIGGFVFSHQGAISNPKCSWWSSKVKRSLAYSCVFLIFPSLFLYVYHNKT